MFFSQKSFRKAVESVIIDWENRQQEKLELNNIVSCEDCKCILLKENAQFVLEKYLWTDFVSGKFYCGTHKKPYGQMRFHPMGGVSYYKEKQEVNEKGDPVGYKKEGK